jgi:hypothetical protein
MNEILIPSQPRHQRRISKDEFETYTASFSRTLSSDDNNIINVHLQFSAHHTLEYAILSPPVCGSCILETALLSTHRHQQDQGI